ncbi:auxin response factor 2A-like [Hevea brasiliensis]|uniref:auxin response factor 2A-like n=1 Tax=Hevea brasiliensis TaxID=3981 RepID=UPI0025D9512E|nr:auxin response factor 2A-like [Hevea brasiliensis]XP_058000918.1 auxin response factor 2A-like [Hevea brasiliensis]
MEVLNGQAASSTAVRDAETALYSALWHACAGPFVTVPREGELVFYFPQGHIEQVEASENQAVGQQIPNYNLPWKILCRVINVQLKVDPNTDEVFAQVTLLPEPKQDENIVYEPPPPPPRFHVHSFSKILTAADTSTYGGLSLLKKYAEESLPPLDMSSEPRMQQLVAMDLHGNEWPFQHIYRGQPKRHLITSGWSGFVTSKRLVPGDAFVFVRDENGGIGVGVRRAKIEQSSNVPLYLIEVATAWEAISRGTMFTVYHRPRRTRPRAEFIIPFDRYMASVATNYSIGMSFEMRFERDTVEHRFTGTIVRIEDIDPLRWRESKWRCLQVRWDETCSMPRPQRVSPWSIQLAATPMQADAF